MLRAPDGDDEYLQQFLHRTTMLLGEAGVARLRDRTVAIAGCGGVGGATALTLARLGVGGFVLADPGVFDPPDLNRQWAGSRLTLGRNKAEVHAELLRQINPRVRLHTHPEGVTPENLDGLLAPADLLIDCLDISVPLSLRSRVYQRAMAQGIYAISAPIFGFGTLILIAEPGGMGMDELIAGFVRVASTTSKLPPGFPDWFFGPHLQAIEREIHKHRVPTSGVAVTVASGLVAAEVARIFLREQHPELEGPPVLPQVLAVDPLRRTFRVMHHRELFREVPADRDARAAALAAAHHNLVMLDRTLVAADLLSDSGPDLPPDLADPPAPDQDPGALAARLYGLPRAVTVFRGRFAEAILAPLVVAPGRVVACNALFPTTRFHLEAAGARLLDVGAIECSEERPFGANVDCARLAEALATGQIGAVWLEPCNNALGGQPISVANLREVRRLTEAFDLPLVLDLSRIWENAALVREREPGWSDRSLQDIVHALCELADACAGSLTKDLRTPAGGVIAVRSEALFEQVRDRTTLMIGDGLGPDARAVLAGSLRGALERGVDAVGRVEAVRALAARLAAVGAPVVTPVGGHAVFVDAAAALPHLTLDEHPDLALANALYVEGGVRVAPNLRTPEQRDQRWVRCAVPVGRREPAVYDALVDAMAAVLERRSTVRGLERAPGGLGGALGTFAGAYAERR